MRWLGGATVLGLGGDVLSACLGASIADREATTPEPPVDGGTTGFPFRPGPTTNAVFASWYENTVDAQDIVEVLASWKLTIDGMVQTPMTFSFADILALPRQDQVTDFHCVEGWVVDDVPWSGVRLAQMLALASPTSVATHLTFYSSGGTYKESLPMNVALEPHTLLAYGVAGSTLPLQHGFPLRLVVPRLYGYKNAKYLRRIELTNEAESGYWEAYGYAYDGEVPTDNLRPGKY